MSGSSAFQPTSAPLFFGVDHVRLFDPSSSRLLLSHSRSSTGYDPTNLSSAEWRRLVNRSREEAHVGVHAILTTNSGERHAGLLPGVAMARVPEIMIQGCRATGHPVEILSVDGKVGTLSRGAFSGSRPALVPVVVNYLADQTPRRAAGTGV